MLSIVKGLMTYATGSELTILDEADVNDVFLTFKESGYNMKALTKAIAQTEKFDDHFNRDSQQ